MKVYIIYDQDGWEIRGIESAFSTLELLHDDTVAEMAYDEGYLWDE